MIAPEKEKSLQILNVLNYYKLSKDFEYIAMNIFKNIFPSWVQLVSDDCIESSKKFADFNQYIS